MRIVRLIATVLCIGGGAAVRAQVSAPPPAVEAGTDPEIVVIGLAHPYRIATGPLRKAQRVFAKGRAAAAPAATLYFLVSGTPLAGLALTLRSGDDVIDLPVDAAGQVVLPDPGAVAVRGVTRASA